MPGLTRTACRTRIRELLSEPVARHYPDTSLNTWINDAVRDISIKTFCKTYIVLSGITTVVNCAEYSWPTEIGTTNIETLGIKTIVNSNAVSLDFVTPEQLGRSQGQGVDNMKWTSWENYIVLSHKPTAIVTLVPYIWAEARQTAAGTLNIPNAYHHLVPFYGVFMGHAKRLELDAAKFFYEYYMSEMQHVLSIIRMQYLPNPMKEGVHNQGETP